MENFNWQEFLTTWGRQVLETDEVLASEFSSEARNSGWLGYPGATEEQIQVVEDRLNISLPPTYREFLRVSNGWKEAGLFIHTLWSIEEVDWHANRHQDLIDAWLNGSGGPYIVPDDLYFIYGEQQNPHVFREDYLHTALEISEDDYSGDGVCLLNPRVIFDDGEWEAWFFASWIPGARRYKSFQQLMQGEYEIFKSIKTQKSQ